MRLINADNIVFWVDRINSRNGYSSITTKDKIESLPTIDAKLVTHAHWTYSDYRCDGYYYKATCSACGESFNTTTLRDLTNYKYCPNCGARMDEV